MNISISHKLLASVWLTVSPDDILAADSHFCVTPFVKDFRNNYTSRSSRLWCCINGIWYEAWAYSLWNERRLYLIPGRFWSYQIKLKLDKSVAPRISRGQMNLLDGSFER